MSRAATAWAWQQRPPRPADKLLLLALADAANTDGLAFPSVAALTAATGLNRKMVIDGLGRLVRVGLIADTGDRIGRTRQVKVWAVPPCQPKRSPIGDA